MDAFLPGPDAGLGGDEGELGISHERQRCPGDHGMKGALEHYLGGLDPEYSGWNGA